MAIMVLRRRPRPAVPLPPLAAPWWRARVGAALHGWADGLIDAIEDALDCWDDGEGGGR